MGAVRHSLPGVDQLVPNDDGSTSRLDLPFIFFGQTHCWVNNNGNISFDQPEYTFTPYAFSTHDYPPGCSLGACVAAFWADVDTRGFIDEPPNGIVLYGNTVINGQIAFVATWESVGYYNRGGDLRNTFQIVLYHNSFELNYDQIQWDLGNASSIDSYDGFPPRTSPDEYWPCARAGFFLPPLSEYGSGAYDRSVPSRPQFVGTSALGVLLNPSTNYQFNFPGSGYNFVSSDAWSPAHGPMRDGQANALISNRRNSAVRGRYVFGGSLGSPLRFKQRDDSLGVGAMSPRLGSTGNNNGPTSRQANTARIPGAGTYL